VKITQKGLDLLMDLEGVVTEMYHDQAGLPTIGVGHLLTQNELATGLIYIDGDYLDWRGGLTREQTGALLRQDLRAAEIAVDQWVRVPLSDHQRDALICFCFNVGVGAFSRSSLVARLNAGSYEAVPGQMRLWNKITKGGAKVVSTGLARRREREIELWEGRH
jgi:lysozyme